MSSHSAAPLPATFSALADSTRMAVIGLLAKEPRRAGDLAASLAKSPAAMSRHLRILRKSGLVGEESLDSDARVRLYHLRREPFSEVADWLGEVQRYWTVQLDAFKQHVEGGQ